MEFSGDYPGVWQRKVESVTGGMAVFLAGAVGSHAPRPPAPGWIGAQEMGERLARQTIQRFERMEWRSNARFACETVDVPLPELQVRLTDGVRLRPWLARRLLPVRSTTRLQVLRLNDALWLSTPCDYSGELALDLKAFAAPLDRRVTVTSFNGDYIGYVVPARYYSMNHYETRTMSFFGPQLPGYFDSVLRRLVETVGTDGAFTNDVGRR
jgi:hypothetical protein